MIEVLAIACLAIWIYLIWARGAFWRAGVNDASPFSGGSSPLSSVAVVIPARNESEFIARSVRSLLDQSYGGSFNVVVVDDESSDDTGAIATRAAGGDRRLRVIRTDGPAAGWTGKLWALKEGIAVAEALQPEYLLLTDADIVHESGTIAQLVARSRSGGFVLTSLMAKLRCESLAERVHVPAFIYFFQMLFPFAWVCRPDCRLAAAAGGCMLVKTDALAKIGGVASIQNALIDDCSLAAKLKETGPIWLGLTNRVCSIRPYETFADVARMISRSAYSQLRVSPFLLAATTIAMTITFVLPPLLSLFASGWPRYLGLAAWIAMALSFVPTLRYYGRSLLWSMALPVIALLYMCYTLNSAYQHLRQRGGQWKGRVHTNAASLQ
jgi:hopene-associated glycosyltransferase HpnB